MSYEPLLSSFIQLMKSRLEMRNRLLLDGVQKVVSGAIKSGAINSGRIGLAVARAYVDEADSRAAMVIADLRQARLSWSSSQIVAAHEKLRQAILNLFKEDLSEAARLTEQAGTIAAKRSQPQYVEVVRSFLNETDRASKAAVMMVDAIITEIVSAAEGDVSANSPTERPSFVIHNTFQGPVASVAQGGSTANTVSQINEAATPQELADIVSLILHALPQDEMVSGKSTATKDLQEAERKLRLGKVPGKLLGQAISALIKVEDLAVKAPTALQGLHSLAAMLGYS